MVKNKMSWTLNALLVGVAAMVVVLPSPSEIRKALEYGQAQRQIVIEAAPRQVVVEVQPQLTAATRQVVIREPEAVNCLEATRGGSIMAIQACIPRLVDDVIQFDRRAEASNMAGNPIYPSPEIEQKRLAVIQLCRAKWSGQADLGATPAAEECASVMQGVAY